MLNRPRRTASLMPPVDITNWDYENKVHGAIDTEDRVGFAEQQLIRQGDQYNEAVDQGYSEEGAGALPGATSCDQPRPDAVADDDGADEPRQHRRDRCRPRGIVRLR